MKNLRLLSLSLLASVPVFACSAGGDDSGSGGGTSEGAGGGLQLGSGGGLTVGDDPLKDAPAPPNCGDGVLDEDEVCDDGNREADDGCWANCLGIDRGFVCAKPGDVCQPFAKCGDGLTVFPEQCDDSNAAPGDGCSATCKVELGYKCDDAGVCSPTTCGDGVVEGAEMCEPSLTPDGGCTAQCQFAPSCPPGGGACTSRCGDGLVLGEACDDGNNQNGDGCDAECQVEDGYECGVDEGACTKAADDGPCILPVPTVFRDFSTTHPDFEGGPAACDGKGQAILGIVETTLDDAGKPVRASGQTCPANFGEWYTDSAASTRHNSEIVLYDDGQGNFVNRWGAAGEQWFTKLGWAGATNCAVEPFCGPYDGNPFFFPVDGIPGAKDDGGLSAAISTNEYGMDGTTRTEQALTGAGPLHNFSFTSEVEYWFAYDASTNATLEFLGDDDVWVFVNGKLALDLGGTHVALAGQFTISGASTTISGGSGVAHGMTPGNVYQIKVFHAERQSQGSSFKLTLSGFNARRSDCAAVCGDGIVGAGEECDDGVNDGGYNECQPGCVLGGYCGDGVVQEGEVCDDADPNRPSGCRGCRLIVVK